ncbi:MAG TPA: inositol monophosphatase family protein [Actinomycetota bacterium]|nr:inositol monophosphatase family protein [Actinomycetota bacterium]
MPPQDLDELAELAERAAHLGGRVVRSRRAGRPERKGAGDYVTEVDRASEAAIARALSRATPGIPVRGEEGGGAGGERYWLVDPLDGTTNFLHGFPAVGVSVALVEDGRPLVGVVHAPFLGETYVGVRGRGAALRRRGQPPRPLRVSDRAPREAVVGTGFPFRRKAILPRYLRMFAAALERFEDLRRPGAASLDLAWVAAGVFDGFFELALSPWDVAAGGLLVEEAGGLVTDWAGGPGYLSGDILAGPPAVHRTLLELARATAA